MKKLILFAVVFFACLGAQAQLSNSDYVTIRMTKEWGNSVSKYLKASNAGVQPATHVSDTCLFQLEIVNGDYRFRNVLTGLYLKVRDANTNTSPLVLSDGANASLFKLTKTGGEQGKYMSGQLYYNGMAWGQTIALYLGDQFGVAQWYQNFEFCIERWEQKGDGGSASSHFNPNKVVFEYAGDDAPANGTAQDVKFVLDASSQSYFECVCREEMLIGKQTNAMDPSKVTNVKLYWLSTGNQKGNLSQLVRSDFTATAETADRTLMTLSGASKVGNDWQFSITPNGKSPMGLKQREYEENVGGTTVGVEKWVDHVDDVIAEYTYDGTTYRDTMRVVRKSYHEEQLPTLTFTINPVTYTFKQAGETKDFSVVATHQHGKAIYNSDNQMEGDPVYEEGYKPAPVKFTTTNLTLNLSDDWGGQLTATINGDHGIMVTANANNTNTLRLADLTGTLCPVKETSHPCDSFTITLRQRYDDAGIELIPNVGKGNTALRINQYGREEQAVHTAERTIFYYDDQEAIELRLPESGYSGYMRWYDYETNGAPNYNHCHEGKISTTWDFAPRSESGAAFAAINTPADKNAADNTDGYSLGHYALNKSAKGSDGNTLTAAILDEDQNNNPAPRIRPWSDNGYHTMACDVSAYTDYEIKVENRQIKSIKEPTLSYRQLFHMRPASDMAERFENLHDGEFLENYSYQAPAGKVVYLSTEYRFNKYRSHISEMCYFYYDKNGVIQRITDKTTVVWTEYTLQNNGTYDNGRTFTPSYASTMDYVRVQEDNYPVQKKYTLTVPAANANTNKDLLIACFEVKFLDIEQYGPTPNVIITQQRIETDYKLLKNINFDNYDSHLPWDYTSYGYVYDVAPLNTDAGFKRGASQGVFPFYGEYTVVESVNKDWANSAAHSGKALYVDGTMEPGLVATISAETNICSGQTVYCSAWFRNPRPNNNWAANGNTANPIFRCNIQGRNGNGEWEDAGVYFVGELLIGSPWQQVVFPIEAAHSYDETRVSIYNFATTNQGNDFMVDDINLYVSLLPIAAYQGKMACRSVDAEHTNAAAVLRIDYSNISRGNNGSMFYQIFNESYDNHDGTFGAPVLLKDEAAYYHDAHEGTGTDHYDYGSIAIPAADYNPVKDGKVYGTDYFYSVSKMLDYMVENNLKHAKAYVKTENSGVEKWLLYVAHLVDNVTTNDINDATTEEQKAALPLEKLYDEHSYVMRMAYTPEELDSAACNLTTPLHATQQTVFTLRNSDKQTIKHTQYDDILTADLNGTETYIHDNSLGNCPNDLYFLTATIVNKLATTSGGQINEVPAPIYADWLVGDPRGDVFSEKAPAQTDTEAFKTYQDRLAKAEAAFKDKYGYTHGQVAHAIMYDMRRMQESNTNYSAKTFAELDPSLFDSHQNYEIVKHLYENEWLQLYDTTIHFYLASKDTARYWCFPIEGTAKTVIEGEEVTLKDCNEPHRVYVTAAMSNYHVNVAPIAQKDKTAQQKLQLPKVNVLANEQNTITSVAIPVNEIKANITGNSGVKEITIDLTQSQLPEYISFFDLESGKAVNKPSAFELGKEYTMRLAFQKDNNAYWMDDEDKSCRVGYIFFTLQVVPNTLVWQPTGTSFNGWGKNENWKGWIDSNGNGKVESDELTDGFVPMEGSNVIIPNLGNAILYPYIVPEHEHDHYPMTVHHAQHSCKNIYFEAGAHIQNQHLLHYEKAFVDMPVIKGGWHMMSAPLQSMYSGDMFVPHRGGESVESVKPFEVSEFVGSRSSQSTYAFWASYYNQTVNTWYDNGTTTEVAAAAEFHMSNGLNQKLEPASGYLLWGEGNENELIVRLPKPNTIYRTVSGTPVSVPRSNANKFAFTATHDNENMNITLKNKVSNKHFVFGNPTMAYINMVQFLKDHENVLEQKFYRINDSQWNASVKATMESNEKYLAPMTSVMLEAKAESTTLSLTLSSSHLTINDQVAAKSPERKASARRVASDDSEQESEIMTIYAFTPNAHARTILATHPEAYDYYVKGEDAMLMTSGVQNTSYVTIPLNLYTVAEQVPMMADVRQGISRIPLAMSVFEECRADYMQLAFYLSSNWSRECYIADELTGQKIRVMDGLIITVEMPDNFQERYFIEGPDEYLGSSNDGSNGTTTAIDNTTSASPQLYVASMNLGELMVSATQPIRDLKVYSIAGQLLSYPISSADCQLSTINCQLPSGVCVVEATLHNGVVVHQQAIVK